MYDVALATIQNNENKEKILHHTYQTKLNFSKRAMQCNLHICFAVLVLVQVQVSVPAGASLGWNGMICITVLVVDH